MSGITGIFHYDREAPVEEDLLRRMTSRLSHRGPNGERYCSEDAIGLGVAHLTNEEFEANPQPFVHEDYNLAVVLDGEIYNARELSRLLGSRGYEFKTSSQAEIILGLYRDFAEACVTMLRGSFAFAVWDGRKQQLLVARDRMGKKPVYYTDQKGLFLFGSAVGPMLEHEEVSQDIDARAVADYFFYHYIPAPKTIYRRIRKLRPGHYLLVTVEGVVDREYWNIDFSQAEQQTVNAWCTQFIDLLYEAVELRTSEDGTTGALLSSGLDASAVAVMMSQVSETPIHTAAFSFQDEIDSERVDAAEFAAHLNAVHAEGLLQPEALDILETLAQQFDEPFADANVITTYYLFQAARERFSIALTGVGGDENFVAYQRYLQAPFDERVRDVTQTGRRMPLLGALSSVYPKGDWLPHVLRGKPTVQQSAAGSLRSVYDASHDTRDSLLSGDLHMQLNAYDPIEVFLEHHRRPQTDDPIARAHYVGIKTHLADNVLTRLDRLAAATSLDVRCPLLDHRLMSFLAHIPSDLKMRGRDGKYLYKRALSGMLPPEILARPKRGYTPPVAAWLRGSLREYADAALFRQSAKDDGLLQNELVARLWNEHQASRRDHSRVLWAVLMFRMWQARG